MPAMGNLIWQPENATVHSGQILPDPASSSVMLKALVLTDTILLGSLAKHRSNPSIAFFPSNLTRSVAYTEIQYGTSICCLTSLLQFSIMHLFLFVK